MMIETSFTLMAAAVLTCMVARPVTAEAYNVGGNTLGTAPAHTVAPHALSARHAVPDRAGRGDRPAVSSDLREGMERADGTSTK